MDALANANWGKLDGNKSSYLTLGASWAPEEKFQYGDFEAFDGVEVPRSISLTELTQQSDITGKVTSRPTKQYEFRLASKTLEDKSHQMTVKDLMKSGMLVSYEGSRGNAGVLYKPELGTFEQQLDKALAQTSRAKPILVKTNTSSRSNPAILPGSFAVLFGGLALFFLVRGKKNHG